MTISLMAKKRTELGKLEPLRKQGFLPAVYYGHKTESTPIKIKKIDFLKAWKNAGESTVIKLETEKGNVEALINAVDLDPLTGEPRHADFYIFEKGHKVEIAVPIEFDGISPAVKDLGGVLVKVIRELKVKAEPSKLPHSIKVDIGTLENFESRILASDIVLPTGVELVENPDEMVASVSEAKEEVVETAPVDLSQIEVEKKGKQEEGISDEAVGSE